MDRATPDRQGQKKSIKNRATEPVPSGQGHRDGAIRTRPPGQGQQDKAAQDREGDEDGGRDNANEKGTVGDDERDGAIRRKPPGQG